MEKIITNSASGGDPRVSVQRLNERWPRRPLPLLILHALLICNPSAFS